MYYPCSENKGADQLHSYCEADLPLLFRIYRLLFSQDVAHMKSEIAAYGEKCALTLLK